MSNITMKFVPGTEMLALTSAKQALEEKGYKNLELLPIGFTHAWGEKANGYEEIYEVFFDPEFNKIEVWVSGETPTGDTYTSYRSWRA